MEGKSRHTLHYVKGLHRGLSRGPVLPVPVYTKRQMINPTVTTTPHGFIRFLLMLLNTGTLLTWHCHGRGGETHTDPGVTLQCGIMQGGKPQALHWGDTALSFATI